MSNWVPRWAPAAALRWPRPTAGWRCVIGCPRWRELFAAGAITDVLVRAIVWRTHLVEDPEALAAVDEELAARVRRWGALTVTKTEQAIDAIVLDHDAGCAAAQRGRCPHPRRPVRLTGR